MESTTIKLNVGTKIQLDGFRQYENETYDEVIRKLIYVAKKVKKEPKLSQKTIKDIEEARERIARGEYYTLDEVKKQLRMRKNGRV